MQCQYTLITHGNCPKDYPCLSDPVGLMHNAEEKVCFMEAAEGSNFCRKHRKLMHRINKALKRYEE